MRQDRIVINETIIPDARYNICLPGKVDFSAVLGGNKNMKYSRNAVVAFLIFYSLVFTGFLVKGLIENQQTIDAIVSSAEINGGYQPGNNRSY